LASNLSQGDKEFVFRIAPNSPIKRHPNSTTLEGIFECQAEEAAELEQLGLNTDDLYDASLISRGLTRGFTVTVAITEEANLGLAGVNKQSTGLLLTDPLGNVYKITTQHAGDHR